MPKISVLIPVFNSETYLEECIFSVLNQSFTDFEIIICDDKSTDNSLQIIKNFSQKFNEKIIFLENSKNLWVARTRNILAKNANGKYLAWLDSDDFMEKNRLKLQYEYLEKKPEIGLLGSNFWILTTNNKKISRNPPENHEEIIKNIFYRNPFWHNTIMIRKEIFTKISGYNENFVVAEDLEFYSRAIFLTKTANLTEELVTYRIHKNNSIRKKAKIMLNNTYKIQKNLIKNGFKISRKEYFFHLCFLIGKTFPPLGKYLIHIPENLRKILQKLKIIS